MDDNTRCVSRKALSCLAALLIGNPLSPVLALASSGSEEVEAEDLFSVVAKQKVTTATLSPIPVSKTPGTVSIVTQKEIQEMGASTLDEVLARLPGVDVRMDAMGNVIDLRTFGADVFGASVQILIDGAPYNGPETGGVPSFPSFDSFPVPVEMIKQVEVIREPVSTLYGSNALHGVINIVTKSGSDLEGGEASARAGSRSLQRYGGAFGGTSAGGLDFAFGANYLRQGGPIEQDKNSTLQDGNAQAKARYKDLTLEWFSKVSGDTAFQYDPLVPKTGWDRQSIQLGTLSYNRDVSGALNLHAQTSYLTRSGSNCQVCHNTNYVGTSAPADHTQSFTRFNQDFRAQLKTADRNTATVGLQYVHDSDTMASGSYKPFVQADSYSGFVEDKLEVVPDKLSLTLGARQDYSNWSKVGGLTSPRALVVYTPSDRTSFRAGITRAHRLPSYEEQQRFIKFLPRGVQDPNLNPNAQFPGESGGPCVSPAQDPANGGNGCDGLFPIGGNYFLIGNPGLKPSDVTTVNVGVDRWVSSKVLVKVNGYFSNVQNSIEEEHMSNAEFVCYLNHQQLGPGGGCPTATALMPGGIPTYAPVAPPAGVDQATWDTLAQSDADIYVNNPSDARELGGEIEVDYRPWSYLDIRASYEYKNVYYDRTPSNGFVNGITLADPILKLPANAPHHLANLSVTAYPSRDLTVNVTGKYRGSYHASSTTYKHNFPPGSSGPGKPCGASPSDPPNCLYGSELFNGAVDPAGVLFLDFDITYRLPMGVYLSLIGRNMFNQDAQEWREITNERLNTGRDLFVQARYPFGGAR